MLTKTKLALAAFIVAGTATVSLAQEADPNLLNRYPTFNGAYGVGDAPEIVAPRASAPRGTFQSAPVGLYNGGAATTQRTWSARPQPQTFHYDSAPLLSGGGY